MAAASSNMLAQVQVEGKAIDIHGFVSQGFALSDHNNYLTMNTRDGSFAFTDGAINASSQLGSKFRVGAQVYMRNIGGLGDWHPEVDWAFGDYKVKDWFGVRAGKVKTVLGLYTDTQDETFLAVWAIPPQSLYPIDLRALTIAHTGVDVYGYVPLRRAGKLSYTGYVGGSPMDRYGGYFYGLKDVGLKLNEIRGRVEGGDLRWYTPVRNLLAGASYLVIDGRTKGTLPDGSPHADHSRANETSQFYVQYSLGPLRFDAEYRRLFSDQVISEQSPFIPTHVADDNRGFYGAASYVLSKRWELGSYYSRFYSQWNQDHSPPDNHIFDATVTARFNFNDYLSLKAEGHFIDGYGGSHSIRGFYLRDNPDGLKPTTNLLIVRLGYNF